MPPQHSSVLFEVPARGVRRRELQNFARSLQSDVAKGVPFTCLVTSDRDLRKWNRQFRGKDYATDVLSFPSTNGEEMGEIAISFDRAKEQAKACGHGVEEELRILMLHGVLHLLGFDHETDRGEMARAERRWRKRFVLPTGLIERVQA
jgi:probable rRNA maturation factor